MSAESKVLLHMRMNPDDNLVNLPDDYIDSVLNTSLIDNRSDLGTASLWMMLRSLWTYDMMISLE